jgi:hypothetical protein
VRGRAACIATTVAMATVLAGSQQASAAQVSVTQVGDPYDYCGHGLVEYVAAPGERNDVVFGFTEGFDVPALTIGPFCWREPDRSTVTDLESTVSSGSGCIKTGARSALCTAEYVVGLQVEGGDRRDMIKVPAGNRPASISSGDGNDAINVANGESSDSVSCGAGIDTVTADAGDSIGADCETATLAG